MCSRRLNEKSLGVTQKKSDFCLIKPQVVLLFRSKNEDTRWILKTAKGDTVGFILYQAINLQNKKLYRLYNSSNSQE